MLGDLKTPQTKAYGYTLTDAALSAIKVRVANMVNSAPDLSQMAGNKHSDAVTERYTANKDVMRAGLCFSFLCF